MKMQSINTIAKRFFLGNLLVAALFMSANAKTTRSLGHQTSVTAATDKVQVKYTGIDVDNQLSFNVKYSNPSGNTFNLIVLDENGEQLFKGVYDNKQFNKTFKLVKPEGSKFTFLIKDEKGSINEKYDVNIKTRVYDDVIVSKG